MYRIHFDTQQSVWIVQFLQFGIYWNTVQKASFATLELAKDYCEATGIASHYAEKLPYTGREYMLQGAAR